jgi:hypothetical protein
MRLAIGHAMVQLPTTGSFVSLTDLCLERMVVAAGSGHLLARLLSSACCPSLQKLRMRKVRLRLAGLQDFLLLEASALSELSLENMEEPWVLELRTPNLRVLRIEGSWVEELTISAPRLEILTFFHYLPDRINVDGGLPCLWRLRVVGLLSHSYFNNDDDEEINSAGIRLLQCCMSARCLHVSLDIPEVCIQRGISHKSNYIKSNVKVYRFRKFKRHMPRSIMSRLFNRHC